MELRDLHLQARAYGKLTPHTISISQTGACLTALRIQWEPAASERDIHDFGSVLYQMLHGTPPPATLTVAEIDGPLS